MTLTAAFCRSFQATAQTLPCGHTLTFLLLPTFVYDSGDLSVLEDPGSTAIPYYSLLVSGTMYHLSFQVPVQDLVTGERQPRCRQHARCTCSRMHADSLQRQHAWAMHPSPTYVATYVGHCLRTSVWERVPFHSLHCTGMRLVVSGTLDNSTNTLYVTSSPQVIGQSSSKDFVDSGGVKNMASITFFLNMCGNQNPIDKPVSQSRQLCAACHVCCVVQMQCASAAPAAA